MTSKMVDLSHLSAMCQNDTGFMTELVSSFIENTPPDAQQMTEAGIDNDWPNVAKTAHKIKPSVKLMGIRKLTDLILQIESEAKSNNTNGNVHEMINRFNDTLDISIKELEALRSNNFEE